MLLDGKAETMDNLYTCLKRESASFQDHVQHCKHSFNMYTLQSVLCALTMKRQDESTARSSCGFSSLRLQRCLVVVVSGYRGSDTKHCITWLLSFVKHLCTLKDTFGEKVIVPLCKNMYVIDEDKHTANSVWNVPLTSDSKGPPPTSLTKVAN